MNPGNRRAIYAALMANSGIAVLKFVGWFFTGAASLLAEAVHSVADTSNQGLLLWGNSAAKRAPTAAHAFGYGRERYFWAFVVPLHTSFLDPVDRHFAWIVSGCRLF